VAREPTRERLAGQLMLALYRSGRQADALAAYRAARSSLVEELGLEPGPELKRLEAAVLAHDPALDLPPQVIPQPATRIPGPRRRRTRPTLAGAAVLVAGTVIATLALAGGTTGPKRLIAADGAGALDPVTGQVAASVAVGSAPAGVAAGAGSIWVTNGADGTVTRIDPNGPHVEQILAVGSSPAGVAYGAGAVWVANALDGTLSRVDPARNAVASTVPVGDAPAGVAAGASGVWVADEGTGELVAVDPGTGTVRHRYAVGAAPAAVTLLGARPLGSRRRPGGPGTPRRNAARPVLRLQNTRSSRL